MSHSGMVEILRSFDRTQDGPFDRAQDMLQTKRRSVMPVKTGIQICLRFKSKTAWIPACAGMTRIGVDFYSTNAESLGFEPRDVQ